MATYAQGRNEKCWVAQETSYGVAPGDTSTDGFVAADAVKVREIKFTKNQERVFPDEKSATRSAQAPVATRKSGKWSVSGYLLGAGAATTAPDWFLLAKAAFGSSATVASTYAFTPVADHAVSLSILRGTAGDNVFSELAVGCVVETFEVKCAGDGLAEFKAEGSCRDVFFAGQTTLGAAASAGDTQLTLADTSFVGAGAVVAVGSEQVKIVSVDSATQVTVTRGWGASTASSQSNGAAVLPWLPSSQTLAATRPIAGVLGSLTLNGSAVKVKGFTVSVKNPIEMFNDHFSSDSSDGFAFGKLREITCDLDARAEKSLVQFIGDAERLNAVDFGVVVGNATGNRFEINLDRLALERPEVSVPADDTAKLALKGRAYATASLEDEIEFKQT